MEYIQKQGLEEKRMERRDSIVCSIIVALPVLFPQQAIATPYNIDGAHVQIVAPAYSPVYVAFTVDRAAGSCAAGTAMTFTSLGANDAQKAASASAIIAVLLSAKLTGTTIALGGDDAGCVVSYVQSK